MIISKPATNDAQLLAPTGTHCYSATYGASVEIRQGSHFLNFHSSQRATRIALQITTTRAHREHSRDHHRMCRRSPTSLDKHNLFIQNPSLILLISSHLPFITHSALIARIVHVLFMFKFNFIFTHFHISCKKSPILYSFISTLVARIVHISCNS